MSRYIDADALKANINTAFWSEIEKIIDSAPTIDAVSVVRCKDCTHYNAGFECLIEGYGIERPPMWYCADGERKE